MRKLASFAASIVLVVSASTAFHYYSVYKNVDAELSRAELYDPVPELWALINKNEWEKANQLGEYYIGMDHLKDDSAFQLIMQNIDSYRSTWGYQAEQFKVGFLDGDSSSQAGSYGALVSDYTSYSDFRDLFEQSSNYINDEDVDLTIAALSALGVGVSAATLVSVGTTTPVKTGVTTIKKILKLPEPPKWFTLQVQNAINSYRQIGSANHLKKTIYDLGSVVERVGKADTVRMIANVRAFRTTEQVATFVKMYGKESLVLAKYGGEDFVKVSLKQEALSVKQAKTLISCSKSAHSRIYESWDKYGSARIVKALHKCKYPNPAIRRINRLEKSFIESGIKQTVLGKKVIQRDQVVQFNEENLALMFSGKAPLDDNGKKVNLHHLKQQESGVIVELSNYEHKVNDAVLHRHTDVSEIDRPEFDRFREKYWRERAESFCLEQRPAKICDAYIN
ncbi:HNH/ENDO VII family nuclease [Vibrio diabolicus]|uniref:HNH/ENDO VII family nuclease n=1 Tax=Vibrio diabolicus TaxID=50719 RepID=UPI00248159F0|nr:HNH/ENDO VII family nuclease [Vibrio diabolicus]